jgi:choline-glycine betaine transporter
MVNQTGGTFNATHIFIGVFILFGLAAQYFFQKVLPTLSDPIAGPVGWLAGLLVAASSWGLIVLFMSGLGSGLLPYFP